MGKIVRFDSSRRRHVPNEAIKREIMAAARRAGAGGQYRRKAHGWNPSNQLIISIGIAAFVLFPVGLHFTPSKFVPPLTLAIDLPAMQSGDFDFCHTGGGFNCVVDGDTFYYRGDKIRIADIDTPETHDYGCDSELKLGNAARVRLQELLNNRAFSLSSIDRDTDRYGRLLRIVERDGESLGGVLVNEGLARWYAGGRQPWC
jgi:micrococcal nuclease